MAAPAKDAGDFNLLITEVDGGRAADAARELASAFSLDEAIAAQIVNAAPIIFADRLTKAEVKAVTPKLVELSGKGLTFRVTARLASKVPKVHWPVRPRFTAAGSGSAIGLGFEWNDSAFICPSCGETYVFKRLGQLTLTEPPSAPKASRSSDSDARTSVVPQASAPARGGPVAPHTTKSVPVVEEETLDFADVLPPEDTEEGLESVEGVDPVEDSGDPFDLDTPADPPAVDLEAGEGGNGSAGEETAVETEAAAEIGESYNVFLSKITEKSRIEEAAKLISKTKGCSVAEAKELTGRLVIPIAKNVSRDEAESILGDFKKIKVFGRMTKAK